MRDLACVGFLGEHHMPTDGTVNAEKEGRTTGEKEAVPTLMEYPNGHGKTEMVWVCLTCQKVWSGGSQSPPPPAQALG